MPNPRLASRYAKSLVDLAKDQNQLEAVYKDMQYLQAICKSNPDFVQVLRSPVISADKKQRILSAITDGKVSALTASFNKLLVDKTREEYLPEIITAVVDIYNELNNIHKIKLTTATELSEDLKQSIINKVKREAGLPNIEIETAVKDELIGGFILEFNNKLVDTSIARDLREIKKQFSGNIYVQQIR